MRLVKKLLLILLVAASLLIASGAAKTADKADSKGKSKTSLTEALAKLKVPPEWYAKVKIKYDTSKPWKEARKEIRRLLDIGDKEHNRRAIKLTCIYKHKNDIGDGHEYPMYIFMGGQYAWALKAYEQFLKASPKGNTLAYMNLASCYKHFGEYEKARQSLQKAMANLPDPPWRIFNQAGAHNAFGDLFVETGDLKKAEKHYREAIRLYPTSKQPYGRHLLRKRASKVERKLEMLIRKAVTGGKLRDGTYKSESLGYSEFMKVSVTVSGGKIADIKLDHKESIDLGATGIIPRSIIAAQSLHVDGITGATITCDAIVDGVYQALKKAGVK